MGLMEAIFEKAKKADQTVAFPEAQEETIIRAARACADAGICKPMLVGDGQGIVAAAAKAGVALDGIEVVEGGEGAYLDELVEEYAPSNPMLSVKALHRKSCDPLYVALMMQAVGRADVTFAGLTHSTGDVIMAGQLIVGMVPGIDTISSMGIFNIPGYEGSEGQFLGFGDSAVCANPDASQLASIAISCCDTVSALLGWGPRCALLSYSTTGSAEGPLVEKVCEARRIANERRPDLAIDGEFQLDAAIRPEVAAKKVAGGSAVAGRANIIVWPDINVGNIGVKLVQTFGKADAYGPMLQGFKKIVCDCSRSAPVSEIVGNVAMSCVRAAAMQA